MRPRVSRASGVKRWVEDNSLYFSVLRVDALSAAAEIRWLPRAWDICTLLQQATPTDIHNSLLLLFFSTRGRYDPSGDIIVIIEYDCLEDQASSSIAEGKVPRKATRLNL